MLELCVVTDMENNKYKETANQIQNVVQRIPRKCEQKNYIEESDEEEISTKKKKQQDIRKVPSPKLSKFKEK